MNKINFRLNILPVNLAVVFCLLFIASTVMGASGSGTVKTGYIFSDEEGSLSLNRETFNTYEGFNLSLDNFNYTFNNGIIFKGNLSNLTLNNRNINTTFLKPGSFSFSVKNNQYRRFYDDSGNTFTRRRTTGFSSYLKPTKNLKLFGGYNTISKKGASQNITPSGDYLNISTDVFNTDYTHDTYNFGAQGFHPYGNLRVEYRASDFNNDLNSIMNRKSNGLKVNFFSKIPNHDWILFSAGAYHRYDDMESQNNYLKTNQLWAATKLYLSNNYTIDYRLHLARTSNAINEHETDNAINTFTIGKKWTRKGGLKAGYENRISDDLVDRTTANIFLFSAWYNYDKLFFRGKVTTRSKDVSTGTTLLGDENYSRHIFSVKYNFSTSGDVTGKIESRIRKNDDISTEVKYTALSSIINLSNEKYGRLSFSYSHYNGKFENQIDTYEFTDHLISGNYYPEQFGKLSLIIGGTYYRSKKDNDLEKFNLNFTGDLTFAKDHHLQIKYEVFNYDNYLLSNNYYTGDIVEINILKDLSL